MAVRKWFGKHWPKIVVAGLTVAAIAVGAVGLSPRPVPAAADPSLERKSSQFTQEVAAQLETDKKATAEALLIRMDFPTDRPLSVLFAGDTLTGGYFASAQDKGFSQLIRASLAQHGEVEEVRGPNSGGKVDTLGGIRSPSGDLDLAVLQLGTIEAGQTMDPTEFSKLYETMLRNLKARSPDLHIVCTSVWQSSGANAGAYDRIVQEQCESFDGRFVSLGTIFSDSRYRGPAGNPTWAGASDKFHPNDAGHKAIADTILARIKVS